MTAGIRRSVAALALLFLAASARPAAAQWYETYNQGVQAVAERNWQVAEQKLKDSVREAARAGRHPGPSVPTYGQLRPPFLPDLYLAIVYANTGRTADADAALKRVQGAKWVKDNDPRVLATRQMIDSAVVANNTTRSTENPPSTGNTGTPAGGGTTRYPPPDDTAARRAQFDDLMRQSRERLTARRLDEARAFATNARALNIDNERADRELQTIDFERFAAQAESQLQQRRFVEAKAAATQARGLGIDAGRADALLNRIEWNRLLSQSQNELDNRRFAAARSAAGQASAMGADSGAVKTLLAKIGIGESEEAVKRALGSGDSTAAAAAIKALRAADPGNAQLSTFTHSLTALLSGDTQRLALLAFYRGDYRETIRILQPLADTPNAAARVNFYLACSEAAIALLGPADQLDARLKTARERYGRAAASRELAADRRFVAPKILRSLEGS